MRTVKIQLTDIENDTIDTAGSGSYGGVTAAELVEGNSSFFIENGELWAETYDDVFIVTGMHNGEPFTSSF